MRKQSDEDQHAGASDRGNAPLDADCRRILMKFLHELQDSIEHPAFFLAQSGRFAA